MEKSCSCSLTLPLSISAPCAHQHPAWRPVWSTRCRSCERALEIGDRSDRSGVDVVRQREVAARPVPDVHEVEQLGQPPLPFRLYLEHLREALLDEGASCREARGEA